MAIQNHIPNQMRSAMRGLESRPLKETSWKWAALAALATIVLVSPLPSAQATAPAQKTVSSSTGNAEHGKKLFASYGCYQCHGYAAQGGVGPRLGPDPVPYSFFQHYVRHPTGSMPVYTEKVAGEQDLVDIYAFLKSLPQPPKDKIVPLLKQ
jgi:mono/diheme cytochrome c family protein